MIVARCLDIVISALSLLSDVVRRHRGTGLIELILRFIILYGYPRFEIEFWRWSFNTRIKIRKYKIIVHILRNITIRWSIERKKRAQHERSKYEKSLTFKSLFYPSRLAEKLFISGVGRCENPHENARRSINHWSLSIYPSMRRIYLTSTHIFHASFKTLH